jgi:hypothetical protein
MEAHLLKKPEDGKEASVGRSGALSQSAPRQRGREDEEKIYQEKSYGKVGSWDPTHAQGWLCRRGPFPPAKPKWKEKRREPARKRMPVPGLFPVYQPQHLTTGRVLRSVRPLEEVFSSLRGSAQTAFRGGPAIRTPLRPGADTFANQIPVSSAKGSAGPQRVTHGTLRASASGGGCPHCALVLA